MGKAASMWSIHCNCTSHSIHNEVKELHMQRFKPTTPVPLSRIFTGLDPIKNLRRPQIQCLCPPCTGTSRTSSPTRCDTASSNQMTRSANRCNTVSRPQHLDTNKYTIIRELTVHEYAQASTKQQTWTPASGST